MPYVFDNDSLMQLNFLDLSYQRCCDYWRHACFLMSEQSAQPVVEQACSLTSAYFDQHPDQFDVSRDCYDNTRENERTDSTIDLT